MRNHNSGKRRSDQPSGRQASEQPEHTGNSAPATSSLHQGQGPDFQTQDPTINQKNQGVTQLKKDKNLGFKQAGKIHQQPFSPQAEPERGKEELPSRVRDDVPEKGDDPHETKKGISKS